MFFFNLNVVNFLVRQLSSVVSSRMDHPNFHSNIGIYVSVDCYFQPRHFR